MRGLRIAVRGNVVAPIAWLDEFFGPHCRDVEDDSPTREIDLVIDNARYAELLATPGVPEHRPIDCFALDGKFDQLELWRDFSGERVLHDNRAHAFLSVGQAHRPIEIIARADHARLRVLLMRAVRELATLQALHAGDLLIHGAAAVYRGRGIIIAGQKRAGKTTMLLDVLRRGQAEYLSNDRVVVDRAPSSPTMRGVPTIAKVREDSLRYLPALTMPVFDPPRRHYLTMEECALGSALMEPTERTFPSMSPVQLCAWIGVNAVPTARIETIVFPRVDPAVVGSLQRRLGLAEAAERIHASLFSAGPGGLVSETFAPEWRGRIPGPEETIDACRALAHAIVACECRIGPRAFEKADLWDEMLAT